MRIRFWGTRGSIAKAGPTTVRYGGNTSCVELRSRAGTLIVLDCGTGAHGLGEALMAADTGPVRGHLLITHTHWDHIQGLPFFAPLFMAGNEWDVYAPRGLGQHLQETLAAQMQYTYFPVTLHHLRATVRYHELMEGTLTIGDVRVATRYLNHPALTLGYRLEADGAAIVYATDHEPYSRALAIGEALPGTSTGLRPLGKDGEHADFLARADLVIHDTQYTAADYPAKVGWGHSTVEYAVDIAVAARVRRLALFHHDPLRHDDAVDRIVAVGRERARASGMLLDVFAAAEGQAVDLEQPATPAPAAEPIAAPAVAAPAPAMLEQAVLIAAADARIAAVLTEAVGPDGFRLLTATDGETALRLVRSERPGLLVAERHLPGADGIKLCREVRGEADPETRDTPVVLVAATENHGDVSAGSAAGVSDWLIEPFSSAYVRTKVRKWLLRTCPRWVKAPVPPGEPRRLAALHRLQILDTAAEERFDRLTRLACHVFDVPGVAVSLVDANRQWFKSCQGLRVRETSREAAFCAHTILGDETLQVPDTLMDPRFADNPFVTGDPYIRFYAGHPLATPDGSRVGTLCLFDRRPRQLAASALQALKDLAALVEREINAGPAA
jgi:phosphoribosyl 1,2-cyclic phosphodiesterase/DNA-binding response OmpR family regulator